MTETCMDPGVSYMNHLGTSIYVLKSVKKTSHCGCSSWLPARGKHTERCVNFVTNFFISDDEGGMTELARIMIRDCKYDVSSPYLSCLLKYIYHYSFGLNNILLISSLELSTYSFGVSNSAVINFMDG